MAYGDEQWTKAEKQKKGRVHSILRQMEELNYKDFTRLANHLHSDAPALMQMVEKGIKAEGLYEE